MHTNLIVKKINLLLKMTFDSLAFHSNTTTIAKHFFRKKRVQKIVRIFSPNLNQYYYVNIYDKGMEFALDHKGLFKTIFSSVAFHQ